MGLTYEMFMAMANLAPGVAAELRGDPLKDDPFRTNPMADRARMKQITDAYLTDPGYDLSRRR